MKKNRKFISAAVATMFALAVPGFSAVPSASVSGNVVDAQGAPVKDAVVSVKTLPNLLPDARGLSNVKGSFNLKTKMADTQVLVVKKTGFLPETLTVAGLDSMKAASGAGGVAKIILKRDPIEDRIDSLMAGMTIDDLVAQMTQAMVPNVDCGGGICGSALQGGGRYAKDFYQNAWAQKIPVSYGKDNVHGVADVVNATVFPHNIGLGATRDTALVRRIGQVVAEEMWAANIDYNFAPALSVPQDERWGRTYEGFGEKPELAVDLGSAFLRGMQGDHFDAEWRVTGTIKHYLGDGATNKGWDRGDVKMSDAQIRKLLLPPYVAAVEQGAQSVMASFNTIRGKHQHVDSLRLTGWLKTELGFDGFVIADWEGIEHSTTPGNAGDYSGKKTNVSSEEAIRRSINAGLDMAMVPSSAEAFMSSLKKLVAEGKVPENRVKDAVRRILRVKIRAGRLDNPMGPAQYVGKTENIGSKEHRAIAREAVQKSLVLLKNEGVLPLAKTSPVFVTGSHADHTGLQCGAWTLGWQGTRGDVPGATSIVGGFDQVAPGARTENADSANTVVYVIGETPYAEWFGDFREKDFNNKLFTTEKSHTTHFESTDENLKQINTWKAAGKKVVLVLVSGRPLPITNIINAVDGFVAAWLPGSEGEGVADVLFGDVKPTGKLPHTWPKDAKQIPINDGDGKKGLFPYGFGLTY
ncbi:MAG: glycoside hydrolase family 3 C-terminal domain-containing protein [Fibrobacter sp.]|nr:glycoside hydrolase family 3 C-terminal domain-containing protein [Fibrobacter sp.]